MFNGEFTVHWREEKDCLVLLGFVDFVDDDSLWGPLIRVTVSGTVAADPQVEDCTKSYFRILNDAFKGALTEGQRDTIAYRVLHRFLRAKGASLQADMADIACVQLKTNYSATSKRWKEGLDATIMTADIAINKDCSNERAARLFAYVGEYLEASGRFMEAANLYDEAARVYVPNSTSAVFHYSYAGLAHKRGCNFEKAEKAYIQALCCDRKFGGDDWDPTGITSGPIFEQILKVYHCILTMDSASESAHLRAIIKDLEPLLTALFCTVDMNMDSDALQTSILNAGGRNQHILKDEVQSKAGSKHALLALAKESNVESFHSSLLKLKAVGTDKVAVVKSGIRVPQVDGKKVARAKMPCSDFATTVTTPCSNPACFSRGTRDEFDLCPCQRVSYCCKVCQVAHWKEHRPNCSYHKNKKRSSNKK
jgi:tetratricopeptide (TPR) repeat protein